MDDQTWGCSKCIPERTFGSLEQQRSHALQYHAQSFSVTFPGSSQPVTIRQTDNVYVCPRCQATFTTKGGTRKHIHNSACASTEQEDNVPEQQLPVIAVPSHLPIPESAAVCPMPTVRQHDDAVLFSCNQTHASETERQRTLAIVSALELQPFAIKDAYGAEQNALAHASVIAKLSVGQVNVSPNTPTPKKRKLPENDPCLRCSPGLVPGLEFLYSISPYSTLLQSRQFIELDDVVCELLNRDWEFSPQLRFACSKILSGCILLNNNNGQAVILNTIEVYGRTKIVDSHRESFAVRKDRPVANSLPPSIQTPYKRVWPLTIMAPEGERLTIGTTSFDALATSSLRLDISMRPSVGCTTPSFLLSSTTHSLATRIFLDAESLDSGLKIAARRDSWSVSSGNLMWQLRQTKTKFHDPSTYYLCRSSSHFASNHPCQPYTIYTLAAYDQSHNGYGPALSSLFHAVSSAVIRDGSDALLDKQTVEKSRNRCTKEGRATQGLEGILSLYTGTKTSIKILWNRDLNEYLETLAQILSTYIATANAAVVPFVWKEFTSPTQ